MFLFGTTLKVFAEIFMKFNHRGIRSYANILRAEILTYTQHFLMSKIVLNDECST